MAGQARRGTRARGQSSRGDFSWRVLAAASAGASGSATATPSTAATSPIRATPSVSPRSTYRNLIIRGMAPDEAASLTAFLAGLPLGQGSWTLKQINDLLFLRSIHESGRLTDWTGRRPH